MGILNWFKKKKDVEATFEEAEQELGEYSGQEQSLQSGPFQIIQEEKEGGCCGGGGCGSEVESSHEHGSSGGCGSGGCGSEETQPMSSGGGGCCGGETAPMFTQVTPKTTLREAGQNPFAMEIMLKNNLPFGCGTKHLSIQEAGKYAGLNAVKIKKVIAEINTKMGNKTTKKTESRTPGKKGGKNKK